MPLAKSSRLRSWTNIIRKKLCSRFAMIQRLIQSCAELRPSLRSAPEHILFQNAGTTSRKPSLHAGVVKSRPQTTLAKQAGQELVKNYGFKKLPVTDPYEAPVGAVLVYGAKRAAGHVEIRTEDGFVSDFRSKTPSRRPLLGIFAKS